MKQIFLFIIAFFCSNILFSQGKLIGEQIVIGQKDTLTSKILNEKRTIWVHVPDGAATNNERFPVVYLLDGNGFFSSMVGLIQQLSTGGNNVCPKMIVVAILNTDRTRDFTPTHIQSDLPMMDSASSITSGGGENFIAFLEKELIPFIDKKYPTAPYKMFVGHSFGGLAVMQTFTHHPNLFNSYICIDPSMWWDKQKLLKQTEKVLYTNRFQNKSLFLGIANTMDKGQKLANIQKDTTSGTRHIRSILKLNDAFKKNNQNGLRFRSKYYPDDTHNSVPLITIYDAIRYLFDFFPMPVDKKDFDDTTGILATKYKRHFHHLSEKMGYVIRPDEMEINLIGYDFLNQKAYKSAESLFQLNIENYPNSFNVYDSYGDYFLAVGDKKNAIIQFKKALSIQENKGSRKKLNELENNGE